MIKTTKDVNAEIKCDDYPFDYQKKLTEKLDGVSMEFNQETINEIILWKVNRYAELTDESLRLINSIPTTSDKIDINLTKKVLMSLINEHGIQLPMATTILRFRNPKIYQIIDQRVYRFLYSGKTLQIPLYNSEVNKNTQIDLYLEYLIELRNESFRLNIPFEKADRIFYLLDKKMNKEFKLKNYGSKE